MTMFDFFKDTIFLKESFILINYNGKIKEDINE